jgi:EAL domain-containing protein (putative c-di-GMP-specific phosphodiesterase class I)
VVIEAAHGLSLEVVAEGVESPEQLAMLGSLECEQVQGFLLGGPVAPSDAAALARAVTSTG